ncbi:hypothetical protein HO173_003031 [Letharia columbiana]|uniref:Uncharacterized protein n=1 Tax=Letharia columbiana TaxID=112416 RepID=A0A8H6G2J9_9LECA|nr:uncharacterized protein HO173_003031 [Letharia columbiana]KAF6239158.1 hypothetical protein HO173_003031 [Letharia columbiana]
MYKRNSKAVASAGLIWPDFVAIVASTAILFLSHRHDAEFGPNSKHAREAGQKVSMDMQAV